MLPLLLAAAVAAGSPSQPRDPEVREIVRLEDAWRQARIDGDTGFLERFYAEEFRVQGMDGKVQSRGADIELFAKRIIKPQAITHGPLDVSVYGRTAVVTGLDHIVGSYGGRQGELWLRFTDVLVKRDGSWGLVLQQTTPTGPG
jgi:ketosteroid isomerase-like protein